MKGKIPLDWIDKEMYMMIMGSIKWVKIETKPLKCPKWFEGM